MSENTQDLKICPLLSAARLDDPMCYGKWCMWYVKAAEQCAVRFLAAEVRAKPGR